MSKELDQIIPPGQKDVSYSNYLKISELLNLQHPLSLPQEHDEMLFIIIHQVYELWFKQIHHELTDSVRHLNQDELLGFLRKLNRVAAIQDILIKQVDVIETMTPVDFNLFRNKLNPASGFQSYQFRLLEFRLGQRDSQYLKFYRAQAEEHQILREALAMPSLHDVFLNYLNRNGYQIPKEVLERDVEKSYLGDERITLIYKSIYDAPQKNYDLYMTLEGLLGFDEKIMLWRYRHVAMVERMIGNRMGTGGSSGVAYLSSTLSKKFFPDIWAVRNLMHNSGSGY
ncbi:MAG: hypothetical protein KBD78_01400 [Oligoflexales bacterium]|nr:hypothetical protein [Oligoflexales bacterium]